MMFQNNENLTTLNIFENRKIRQVWHNGEWFFSVVDFIAALTDNATPNQYWTRLKARVKKSTGFALKGICTRLKLPTSNGMLSVTDCANTANMFHIVQYIPSPEAEPFKRWLIQLGVERLAEINDPEQAFAKWQERVIRSFMSQGDSEDDARTCSDSIILGDLRKGLTAMELTVTMFGENLSRSLHIERDSHGFVEVARDVDDAARLTRQQRIEIEKLTGKPVVSATNMQMEKDGGLWALLPPPDDEREA